MKVQTVLLLAGAAAVQGIQPRIVLPPVEILRPYINASQLQGVKVETVQGRKGADDKHYKFPPAADEAVKKTTSSIAKPTTTAQFFDTEGIIPFQGLPFPSVGPIVVKDQEVPEIPEIPEIPIQEPVPTTHTSVHATTYVKVTEHFSRHHTRSHTSHTPHTHQEHESHTPHAPHASPPPHTTREFYTWEHHTPTFAPRSPPMTTSVTPAEEPSAEDREEDDKVTTKHSKTPKATSTAKHPKTKYPKGSKPVKEYPLDPTEPREPNEGDRDVHEEQQGLKDKEAKKLQEHEEHKSSRLAHKHETEEPKTSKTHAHKTIETTFTSVAEITETTKTHTHKAHTHTHQTTESSMHLDARGVQVSCSTSSSSTTSPCHTTTSTTSPCHTSTFKTTTIVVAPSGIVPGRNTTCEDEGEGEGQAAHVPISGAVENTAAPVMALIAAAAAGMLLF
ncbi:hypothetical protein E4U33_007615 [Claviceps sp. LM78 group G4]|nr:hypothetical protein E4U33_007615 [Claviceps sp. LM78 group G4]